jgi:hypothetical protein
MKGLDLYFQWFVIAMVWAIAAGWAMKDLIAITKRWKYRKENHDEIFGYVMGILLGTVGMIGAVKFHLGL